ncbi:MAG TPA: helix-turn-helix domain-containing protein [Marmoricola sp.]|jgi:DNA-binding HxlR family transcriptional regulator|nr:helix-turn-helix domain-containing protein [Marmoricola sp.]
MAVMDLLGRRWALRILWELSHEPMRALDLKGRCDDMSSSVLYQRLRELSEAGLVSQDDQARFAVTPLGGDLRAALEPLNVWSRRWAERA